MARPHKNGLDYFPFDTKPDMKMNAVIRKYGATGLGCLVGLYQKIYDNGYFIKADFDFIEDLCLELSIDDEDYLKELIKFCVKKNLFNEGLYKSEKILTSTGIQKRFNEATKRRKCKHDVDKYLINDDNNKVNVSNNEVNADISTQIESKEKKKEVKTIQKRIEDFKILVGEVWKQSQPDMSKEMVRDFFDYWAEHGPNDTKLRFEKEKTFGLSRRMSSWKKNNFNNNQDSAPVSNLYITPSK